MAERRRASLRRRVVAAATAVVAVALLIGAVAFLALFRWSLLDGARQLAESDASAIGNRIEEAGVAELTDAEVADDDRLLQLIGSDGALIASSEVAESMQLTVQGDWTTVTVDDEPYLVVAEEVDDSGTTLLVGIDIEDVDQSIASVVPLVVVAIPVLLLLVGGVTWVVVGRALRPVESLRREVEAISSSNLGTRVDEPPTGDEIHRLAVTMNGMLERLESSQRRQAQFVSDASHELRSPLASLRQFAEVAGSYPGQVTADELAAAIQDEGGRLESIVRAMLVLARADEGGLDSIRREVDLDDVLRAEVTRLRASTAVEVDATAIDAARVVANPELLAQVVRNLVDNAARHASGRVALSVREEGGDAVVTIEDDGAGIPHQDRDRVFERFVRLDEARARESGGSGLGLAIVREIVGQHGGTVRIVDGSLGGARVELRLPSAS